MQDFFSFILYPVSAVLWFWHKVFGFVLPPNSGFTWALSVFFLVFTLRLLLIKPALSQLRSGRKMQKFAPQMQKMREKYKNDRQKMAEEMRKLQSEHGVNSVGGCLPALLQIPVFLSLVTVLRDFQPGVQKVFIFGPQDVESFVNAHVFGAKLGNYITQPAAQLADFGTDRTSMMVVGIPLMIISSVATFFTMRLSLNRQGGAAMGNPQSAMLSKAMMYLAPVGLLVSGAFWPLALLLYFLANNAWTLGQQHFLTTKVEREEEREKERERAAKKEAPRPKPGQKPEKSQKSVESQNSGESQKSAESRKAAGDDGQDGEPESTAAVSSDGSAGTSSNDGGKSGGAAKSGGGKQNGAKQNGPKQPGKSAGTNGGGPAGQSGNKSAGSKSASPKSGSTKSGGKKSQQKNRPGKQAASARKSQKKRR